MIPVILIAAALLSPLALYTQLQNGSVHNGFKSPV